MNRYHTGEQIEITATLSVNNQAIDVSGLTVTAVLIHASNRGTSSSRVTCTKPGAAGAVLATWPGSETAGYQPGRYAVQFWTADGPYCHLLPEIEIAKGYPA